MAVAKYQCQLKVTAYDGSRIEAKGGRLSTFRSLYLCMSADERLNAQLALKELDEKYPAKVDDHG